MELGLFVEGRGLREVLGEGNIIEVVKIDVWDLYFIIVVSFDGMGERVMHVENWNGGWDFSRYFQSFGVVRKEKHLLWQESTYLRLFRGGH